MSETRVEYEVRCADGYHCADEPTVEGAREQKAEYDNPAIGHSKAVCPLPHRIIKRTITEEDVTDA